ncbi:hypothetical protein CBS76997_7561 [Aspergillus niger]|nr:hypothetical protein CBS13152_7477 [Aspergillus niger]KAI3039979.1 hypothetical protein CBS76997_7561 [Aspergillus niger]
MREKETSRGSSSSVPRADITDDPDPTEVAQKPSNKWAGLQHNAVAWLAFCISVFCCNFSPLVPSDYLPFKANEAGMDLRLSQYTLYMFNAGSMPVQTTVFLCRKHAHHVQLLPLHRITKVQGSDKADSSPGDVAHYCFRWDPGALLQHL